MAARSRQSPRRADHILQRLNLKTFQPLDDSGLKLLEAQKQSFTTLGTEDVTDGVTLSLTDWLWKETEDIHQLALNTPFIQGMKSGTFDPMGFGVYNLQDAVYCYNATDCWRWLAVRSNGEMEKFAMEKLKSYNEYTKELFEEWHIQNPAGVAMGSAAALYGKHEENVTQNMHPIYGFISMIPCSRLWPWLGEQVRKDSAKYTPGVYKDWIEQNLTGHGYKVLEAFINEHSKSVSWLQAKEVYTKSMMGEYQFFNSVK